jgi:hypothetical protein
VQTDLGFGVLGFREEEEEEEVEEEGAGTSLPE